MKCAYLDITERIDEQPKWFDEHGVPRYGDFHPKACSNIYANEVCLFRIRCQGCHDPFDVELTWYRLSGDPSLTEEILTGTLVYGDPPNMGCCPSGPTMSSDPVRVLQFWRNEGQWVRVPELEVRLDDD